MRRLTPVSWCCGYAWCEFLIRSMTTKKGLQKRRPTTLSCGMLEVQWVAPLVWKAHEQYFITCWTVGLLAVNLVLSLFLSWAVSWFWGRIPLSLFSNSSTFIYTGKKLNTICRQNFVDSVLNWKAILGKPVQMSFISLSLQSCAAGLEGVFEVAVVSLPATSADGKAAFTFPGIIYMQKYYLWVLVCSVPKRTVGK